jgi:CheY-like chemotaxis protein
MRRRIVIADDDSSIVSLVSMRLRMGRFDVLSAQSGPEALRLIRKSEPVAVILDVNMPGGDGLAALSALKGDSATCRLPVMMLSGDRDPDTVERHERRRQRLYDQAFQSRAPQGARQPPGAGRCGAVEQDGACLGL